MRRERLYLFDPTLRDGAQTNGVDFTLQDKQVIARMLDDLGIDYVEGGYPGANPTDTEFFAARPKLSNARFTAFGMTRRPGRSASNDPGLDHDLPSRAAGLQSADDGCAATAEGGDTRASRRPPCARGSAGPGDGDPHLAQRRAQVRA